MGKTKNDDNKREFRGVWTPAEIFLDERLNCREKGILSEIIALDNERGCFASNDYLAKVCQCSAKTISRTVKKLCELGYAWVESFDGRHRVLRTDKKSYQKFTEESPSGMEADDHVNETQLGCEHGHNCPHSNIDRKKERKKNNPLYIPPKEGGKDECVLSSSSAKGGSDKNPSSSQADVSETTSTGSIPPVVSSEATSPVPETVAVTHTSSRNVLNRAKKPAPAPTSVNDESTPDVEVVSSSEVREPKRYAPRAFEKKYPYLVAPRDRVLKYLENEGIRVTDIRGLHKDLVALAQPFIDRMNFGDAALVINSYLNYLESDEYKYQRDHAKGCPRILSQKDFVWKYDKIRAFKNDPSRHFDAPTMLSY